MARTVGHNYQEYVGWKLYKKEMVDRKYGSRQQVRIACKHAFPSLRTTTFAK